MRHATQLHPARMRPHATAPVQARAPARQTHAGRGSAIARGILLSAGLILAGCAPAQPPAPPRALPPLERPALKLPAGGPDTANVYIPRAALVERGGLPGVFVLNTDNVARFRLVRPGKNAGERLEILSGLRAGETLVLGDLTDVRDGSPVITKPAVSSSPSGRGTGEGITKTHGPQQ